MQKPKLLISVPTIHHIEIAIDELDGLKDLGFECEPFSYAARHGVTSTGGRLITIFKNAFNLVKLAYRFKPDIVYFNSRLEVVAAIRDFITIAVFKSLYFKTVRFMIKSHGSDVEVLSSKAFFLGKVVLPFLRRHVSAWLFLSQEEKQKVIATGFLKPARIFTTKNIVRIDQFKQDASFKSKHGIPYSSKVLLFVGRIIREKGIFEVVEAFKMIANEFDAVLIIVGDGSEFENVKAAVARLGCIKKIILTGFIPEKDVVEYYANSDILVFPTYFPEGFPMALFNSVAAGLGILTTPIRAATDFLTEPGNCLWVEPQNNRSIYKSLCMLFKQEKLLSNMKVNNKNKAIIFSKEKVCADLSKIIYTIMS